jgi:ligand-binding SRPBCC domain-containing protein
MTRPLKVKTAPVPPRSITKLRLGNRSQQVNLQAKQVPPEMQDWMRIVGSPSGRGSRLEASQLLPYPRDQVFEFFSDASNLQSLTPAWLHFSVITPPPLHIAAGTRIDYRLRLHGVPFCWQSRISVWEPPLRFVDEQTRGPYRRWRHEHIFEAVEGGTLCHDLVDYAVYGGSLIDALFVRRDLFKIFAFRRSKLRELFPETGASTLRLNGV